MITETRETAGTFYRVRRIDKARLSKCQPAAAAGGRQRLQEICE